LIIPNEQALIDELEELAQRILPIRHYLQGWTRGVFEHPDGRKVALDNIGMSPGQIALLCHLCRSCATYLSVEAGFGMGSSATAILGMRRFLGPPFEHVALDPYGVDGRDTLPEEYLAQEFGSCFRRLRVRSEIGFAQLLEERGEGSAGLIFIDGSHHFERVLTDFAMSDHLCPVGGCIVLDDARYPAIEAVVNYVRSNRTDYEVHNLPTINTAVFYRTARDGRRWFAFEPFAVPDRRDWTASLVPVRS
jgi:hypothetical protein